MPPLLTTNIRFKRNRIGKLGVPKQYTAVLYPNCVVFTAKRGADTETIPLASIAKAGLGNSVIVLRLHNGETRSLFFEPLSRLVITQFLLGGIISAIITSTGKPRNNAKAWLEQLRQWGVDTASR